MQSVTLRAFAAAVLALLAVTSMANAQQEGVYTIPHYKFETGQEMDNVKIGYVTYGNLNADKSNAVQGKLPRTVRTSARPRRCRTPRRT